MTSDILKRAAEAVKGTTPGPWRNETRYSFIAHDNTWHVLWDVPNSTGVCLVSDTGGNTASCKNDARFIAAARTLIPDMAAAIAERDAENARLTARAEAAEAMVDRLADAARETREAILRLQSKWRADSGWAEVTSFAATYADDDGAPITEALAAHAAMKEGR